MPYEAERQVAVEAVLNGCALCRTVRESLVSEETIAKRDRSPVTVADFGAQAVVSEALYRAFPQDPVVGEEDASALRTPDGAEMRSRVIEAVRTVTPDAREQGILAAIDRGTYAGGATGRHWTLDPIDGTKGFLRNEQYAVALALIEEGQVVLAVLGCPNLPVRWAQPEGERGCLFAATRGQGARMGSFGRNEETAICVSTVSDPRQASFCESVEAGHSSHGDAARVAELLGVSAPPIRMDSQAKYGAVARGDAPIYLRLPTVAGYEERIWDHAAGALIIQEAGGRVTDTRGQELDFSLGRTLRANIGVVATNGRLHDRVLAAVGEVLAKG